MNVRAEAWCTRQGRAESRRAIRGTRFACAAHNLPSIEIVFYHRARQSLAERKSL